MRSCLKIFILIFGLCFIWSNSFSQKKEKIDFKGADYCKGKGLGKNKIVSCYKNVIYQIGNTLLYCDSSKYNKDKNYMEAFGNVRIVQGDSISMTGNKLTYDGNTKKAVLTGNVFLRDKTMTLTSQFLEYNLNTKEAYYTNGGNITDGKTNLTSQQGYYSTESKIFRFKKNVKVVNYVKNYSLSSDTLHYNSQSKIATFKGTTTIKSGEGTIIAEEGEYNTVTGQSVFHGKTAAAKVQSKSYTLTADKMYYDEKKKAGVVKKNVRLYSEKDKIIIEGDEGLYWEDSGISKVFGNAVMKSIVNKDTLYLTADTLISIDNPDPQLKRLLAFNKARIYKSDMQGKCDSLAYNFVDSTINFYEDPVLWNGENQISADSINIEMVNQEIRKMNLKVNSFIISEDTLLNYNQVKGKNMTAHFKEGDIYKVDVDGNGESIYFALENDSTLTGMNRVICSNMIIRLKDNKVSTISFLEKPDGKFVPPHELAEPDKRLKGFKWRKQERPKFEEFPVRRP